MSYNLKLRTLTIKTIGIIGEDYPISEFTNVKNLNEIKHNFPLFDLIGEKNRETYVFSVKARKKRNNKGDINPSYNLLTNKNTLNRRFEKVIYELTKYGYDVNNIHYCFLIAPIEENEKCVYYWGELTSLKPNCLDVVNKKVLETLRVYVSDEKLKTYNIFGEHEWKYIEDKYIKNIN